MTSHRLTLPTARPPVVLPPAKPGAGVSSSGHSISSSAKRHDTALWIVASLQRTARHFGKVDTAKDFSCAKKPLA